MIQNPERNRQTPPPAPAPAFVPGPAFALALIMATLLLPGGCAGGLSGMRLPSMGGGVATPYDGSWAGRFQVEIKTASCRLSQGALRMTVDNGYLRGRAITGDGVMAMIAELDGDGNLLDVHIGGTDATRPVTMTGQFAADTAQGIWQNKFCKGRWQLRKAG